MRQPDPTPPTIAALSRVSTQARPGQAALHDLSFSVGRGEVLTLLGTAPSTVGASGLGTVLSLIAGFTRADSGQVLVGGRIMDATPPHRRHIGMVARQLSLFPHLDVAGHARFAPGVTHGQADAVLHRLDLAAFARRRPHSLTPEIQFRVALARALAPGPSLLLLEDPLRGFSSGTAGPLKVLLRAIADETGLAILHTSDDATTSFGLADRVAVLQAGVLRQIGRPQELYDEPQTLAVAQAMGPLNKLAGSVIDTEDDLARIRLSGGAVVEARFIEALNPGDACVVTLRPERIAVAAVLADDVGDGAVPARLIETVFAGDQMRLRFSLDSRGEAAPDILVTRPSGAALPRSPSVCLAWQPHHAHAFRTETA